MTEHAHEHDDNCTCGCHDSEHEEAFGAVDIETHLHDEACVVSGQLALRGDETRVKAELQTQLKNIARAVGALGGIVGHVKASCETTTVDMYSVTDVETSSKRSPESTLRITLAAIVFAVDPEEAEQMVRHALEAVRGAA